MPPQNNSIEKWAQYLINNNTADNPNDIRTALTSIAIRLDRIIEHLKEHPDYIESKLSLVSPPTHMTFKVLVANENWVDALFTYVFGECDTFEDDKKRLVEYPPAMTRGRRFGRMMQKIEEAEGILFLYQPVPIQQQQDASLMSRLKNFIFGMVSKSEADSLV